MKPSLHPEKISDTLEQIAIDNQHAEQTLSRVPEPLPVTTSSQSVTDYNRILQTNMTANYAISLDLIYRCRRERVAYRGIDLACGPGLYTACLAKYLRYDPLLALDLSQPMLESARRNARELVPQRKITFQHFDIRQINTLQVAAGFDLFSFTNSAHHLDSIAQIADLLQFAERVCRPTGLILVSDLARLKNREISDRFVAIAGREYTQNGMPGMYQDFVNSMYAAWLPAELVEAVPRETARKWYILCPEGFGPIQALIGLPAGQEEIYLREGLDWHSTDLFQSEDARDSARFLLHTFRAVQPVLVSGPDRN